MTHQFLKKKEKMILISEWPSADVKNDLDFWCSFNFINLFS